MAAGSTLPIVPNTPLPTTGYVVDVNGDVGPLSSHVGYYIKNGPFSTAKCLLVKPTLAQMWHWCPIKGLPSSSAIRFTSAYIKVAMAQVLTTTASVWGIELARKVAIILGVTRAVVTEIYDISDSNLVPDERAEPMLIATAGENQTFTFNARADLDPNVWNELNKKLVITNEERAAISAIHKCAIGIPPVQGYSLFMTQRHYVSDPTSQSWRAFDVIERVNWRSPDVKYWWDANIDTLRDALWHKTCHPLTISLKLTLAQSPAVKRMLVEAGAGPAACRLPAMELEVRTAKNYMTILQTVCPMYEMMGKETNYMVLDEALAAVDYYPMGAEVNGRPPIATIPQYVTSRSTAIVYLKETCEANINIVAHAFGFFCAMSESNVSNNREYTLVDSISMGKLKSTNSAAYLNGRQFFDDYSTKKAQQVHESAHALEY